MGGRGIADRDVQDERRRSAALLQRGADAPRQRMAAEPHRRADALALGRREKRLIVKRPGEGSESAAYQVSATKRRPGAARAGWWQRSSGILASFTRGSASW